jgi:hypothetical protein
VHNSAAVAYTRKESANDTHQTEERQQRTIGSNQGDELFTCDIAQRDQNKNMRAIELARVCSCSCKAVRLFVVLVGGVGGE